MDRLVRRQICNPRDFMSYELHFDQASVTVIVIKPTLQSQIIRLKREHWIISLISPLEYHLLALDKLFSLS